MGNQRLIQTQTAATDRKQHVDKRTKQSEHPMQEVLGSRAASRYFRAQLQRHQAEGAASPNPLHSILPSISPVSPRAIQAKPMFRGLSHELPHVVQQNGGGVRQQGDLAEEELLQGKFATDEMPTQFQASAPCENRTGMPDLLKAGLEQLSGLDLSGARVHYNSAKPAQLNALAYTQGQDIEVESGQERHLPHEGWHVVQQMQGRVKPMMQAKGVSISDDAALEREADVMGAKALQMTRGDQVATNSMSLQRRKRAASPFSGMIAKTGGALCVQRVIATTTPTLLGGAPVPLHVALNNLGGLITAYNNLAQNIVLAPQVKMQQQFDAQRVLQRAIYPIMNQISTTTLELSNDPTAQVLHTLHNELETEHRQLITTMVNNPLGHAAVNPFDTNGMNPVQINQARTLWDSLMNSTGKVKLVGNAANQEKVRSWITQLMDTPHGRNMLEQLNAADIPRGQTLLDEMSNVYIGQNTTQLPGTVTGNINYNPLMQPNPQDAQAQPLHPEAQTGLSPRAGGAGAAGYTAVANPDQFVDEVLGGNRGVSLNGAEYDFGVGSGSFVNMESSAHVPTVAGPQQALGPGGAMLPTESYMPDWVLLGHELGHSLNMRAGAATSARKGFATPMSDFSAAWSGAPTPLAREGNWYGGSEEYINIVGNENQLRQQSGLDQRTGHTTPRAPLFIQRGQAIQQALTAGNWMGQCGAENATMANEYNIVLNNHITQNLTQHTTQPQFNQLLLMAQRFNTFATAWAALRVAHDNASKTKQFGLFGWWKKAQSKIVGIGNIITTNNIASYNSRLHRIQNLTPRY